MDNKNKRAKILKEETINQVTLEDLLDLGSTAQMAILKFTDNCMKFNNRRFQQLSTRLNKDLGDLCNMIRQEISQETDSGGGAELSQLDVPGQQPESDRRHLMANESDNLGIQKKPSMDALAEARIIKKIFKKLMEAFGQVDQGGEEDSLEPTQSEGQTIDLSSAFSTVMEGLSTEQFEAFKAEIVNGLKGAGITDQNYMAIVSEIEQTQDIDSLNFALDGLYDYGDENGIEINTEVKTEETDSDEEEADENSAPIIPQPAKSTDMQESRLKKKK